MTNNINISVLLSACITSDRRAGSHQGRSNEHILCCLEIAGRKRNDRHVLYVQKLWVGSPSGGGGNLAFLARKGDGARPCCCTGRVWETRTDGAPEMCAGDHGHAYLLRPA